jgi:hypothetical protein
MSHPPPDRFHRHFQILYALERYLYIPFALFTILLKYVRLSQGIRKLCGTAIIPRLTAIHRPINRVSSGRRKIDPIKNLFSK